MTSRSEMTPEKLTAALQKAVSTIQQQVEEYAKALKDAAMKQTEYKKEYAKRYLDSAGTVAEREARVLNEVGELYTQAVLAEAYQKAAKSALDSQYAELNALQSIGATMRAEMELSR